MLGVRMVERAGGQASSPERPAVPDAQERSVNRSRSSAAPTDRRRWTINGDFVSLSPNGVARYAREVTSALDDLMAERHPLTDRLDLDLLIPRPPSKPLDLKHINIRLLPEFSAPRLPQFWVQFQLPRQVAGGLLSFCNLAPVMKRKQIVCIHDLHTRLAPESYGLLFRLIHRIVLPIVGRQSRAITTVSEFSRQNLDAFGIAPADKTVVTYNGSDHTAKWRDDRFGVERSSSPRPFVLCFGQKQKYKNVDLVLKIAPVLHKMGIDIHIVGDLDQSNFSSRDNLENVKILGRLADADLALIMSQALCLLFPSRIEGFGLPVVEAMSLGCPVITSTAPCLPEISGDAAMLLDPDDQDGWIEGVRMLESNPDLRAKMIQDGYEQARNYSWRKIALIYLQLMARIDEGDGSGVAPESLDAQHFSNT
jgi:glycosyltransferase involved in cell wall biosynthesis